MIEARACLELKAYVATAIMCRKTLEGIAEDINPSTKSCLRVKELKKKGIMKQALNGLTR